MNAAALERSLTFMATAILRSGSAAEAIRENPLPFLRSLSVSETEAEVTISGSVSSYYYKQLAQEAVLPVIAGRRLRNLVVVKADR
jgi:hypothetical protein